MHTNLIFVIILDVSDSILSDQYFQQTFINKNVQRTMIKNVSAVHSRYSISRQKQRRRRRRMCDGKE